MREPNVGDPYFMIEAVLPRSSAASPGARADDSINEPEESD